MTARDESIDYIASQKWMVSMISSMYVHYCYYQYGKRLLLTRDILNHEMILLT